MRVSRAKLRGKSLDEDCKKAYRAAHEYGPEDNRVFCYGLIDLENDEPLEKCKVCGAYVENEEPPKGEEE